MSYGNLMDDPEPLEYVPPPSSLSIFRRFMSLLPGFCGYCGRRYRECSVPPTGIFSPLPSRGRCCPDSHEGFIDRFNVFAGMVREWSDNVKARAGNDTR